MDSTDFEKLLFLYCKFSNKNHYDFFPYKFGCFSFLSYQDKRVLIKQGVLEDAEKFSLSEIYRGKKQYLDSLKHEDKLTLNKFAAQHKKIKGKELVKKTYRDFPYYASKSEIAEKVMNENELSEISNSVDSDNKKALFTLGYEGLTIDAYIDKLISNNIKLVIDVRKNPLSMKYGFSKNRMKTYLEKAGIDYAHIPGLGIISKQRENLNTKADYNELFKLYKKEVLSENEKDIDRVIQLLNDYNRAALTCFEADHTYCHRHKVTDWIKNKKLINEEIIHI